DENERMIRTRSIGTTLTPLSITTRSKSRAAGGLDTIMYVVNYSNNEGFVFVSNDDRDGEILMYSGDGNFAMQDTAGNPGLKLHVEMMLAYQEHKLSEIRDAEARGEEYKGNMITEKLTQEMMPNIVTESTSRITSGMPGHICNVTGQPGMPGSATRKDICAPETYVSKDWEGDVNAIDLAQNKYKNQKCFGVPVNPPYINFMTTGNPGFLGPDGEAPPCVSTPYCTPPLWSYKEYYHFYGCKMSMHLRTKRDIPGFQIGPLLSTYWDQGAPLMRGNNDAGCAPIAIAQLMAYHNMPKIYGSKAFGGVHRTEIDELRKLKTNIDITNSYYCYAAQNLLQEIRVRLDVEYNDSGSTSTSANFRMKKTRKTLESFGYIIGYNNGAFHHGVWDYYRDYNFSIVRESIINRKPVYIRGNSKSGGNGHQWLL
ncbi:MAG: Spi family protease inhibitor, partial [Bacteroidales bacterium]